MFTPSDRRSPDPVEADFVKFKSILPEVHEHICSQIIADRRFPLDPLVGKNLVDEDISRLSTLAPWGYGFEVAPRLATVDFDFRLNLQTREGGEEAVEEMKLRHSVLCNILEDISSDLNKGSLSLLDLATNCGIIPLLLAKTFDFNRILACDISEENISKANFLLNLSTQNYLSLGEDHVLGSPQNIEFIAKDAYDVCNNNLASFDIVSAFGIFYHLSDPIGLLTKIRASTNHYAIIDTISHNFPFSGWIQTISRHVKYAHLAHANDTRKIIELHPTTRGMIDSLYQVGFNNVSIYQPSLDLLKDLPGHNVYKTYNRIFFVASV